MTRVFAYPLLWLGLLAMWLLLNGSVGLGQLLLGAGVASLGCWAVSALEPPKPRIRRFGVVLRLAGVVVADIVRSNFAVLGLILSGREPRSTFVTIPLELTEPNALAVLSCIITATPGSAWVKYDSRTSTVLVHVLDTTDGDAWVATLKRDYETRLLEIFQ